MDDVTQGDPPDQDEGSTRVRTLLGIDDGAYELSWGQDLDELRRSIVAAHHATDFVEFTAVGDRQVHALITPHTRVVFSATTAASERWDVPEVGSACPGDFDFAD